MIKKPLFLKFANKEMSVYEMLQSFSRSSDKHTAETAVKAMEDPPDLNSFQEEFIDALRDIIKEGIGEEFIVFVNHYMEPSLEEDVQTSDGQFGENIFRFARVKNDKTSWIQGLICYNLCLYIKAYGLENVKSCKVCGTFFNHKGKYAVYCSDNCKTQAKRGKI